MTQRTDILIVGGGLVGASLALALDASGRRATLLEAAPVRVASTAGSDDNDRNLVLARASVNALKALHAWPQIEGAAGTIRRVEVSRAGEFGKLRMTAEDAGVDALGRVVPGRVLGAALNRALEACRHVQRLVPAALEKLEPIPDRDRDGIQRLSPSPPSVLGGEGWGEGVRSGWRASIRMGDELRIIEARLVVGADGSDSLVRAQVGIGAQEHDYAQSLFVCTIACERDLPDCAFERFSDEGPVALLPLPNQRRGLVLTVSADRHDEVAAMDDAAFVALAQQRFGWKLGQLSRPGQRFAHRIRRVLADAVIASRAVLVGNAAQTVHPIGAQGFNLGLRDALALAELIGAADDPGASALLNAYAERRQPDRDGVLAFSHGLVALGCLPQPALAPLRSLVMLALGSVTPLRHAVARRGMGFRGEPPTAALDAGP
ncbi:MAG: 2-polyprenyl-6-methoxyphenol hydroxylase [Rhodanobacteraceae bacterium]|jgi:2-octaprenyl-6-methoxyphenol hydroxylase|nr:MAG: 2-polyprenyl-6-methoxyphenol hydroxylase [Rhodanobacteraceae bacterium]